MSDVSERQQDAGSFDFGEFGTSRATSCLLALAIMTGAYLMYGANVSAIGTWLVSAAVFSIGLAFCAALRVTYAENAGLADTPSFTEKFAGVCLFVCFLGLSTGIASTFFPAVGTVAQFAGFFFSAVLALALIVAVEAIAGFALCFVFNAMLGSGVFGGEIAVAVNLQQKYAGTLGSFKD